MFYGKITLGSYLLDKLEFDERRLEMKKNTFTCANNYFDLFNADVLPKNE